MYVQTQRGNGRHPRRSPQKQAAARRQSVGESTSSRCTSSMWANQTLRRSNGTPWVSSTSKWQTAKEAVANTSPQVARHRLQPREAGPRFLARIGNLGGDIGSPSLFARGGGLLAKVGIDADMVSVITLVTGRAGSITREGDVLDRERARGVEASQQTDLHVEHRGMTRARANLQLRRDHHGRRGPPP